MRKWKENTRLLNIFVASHRVQVTEEFFDAVVKESGITEQELADMKLSAYGQGLNNEMSVSSNLAYMEGVRDKLVKAIRKMDVGNVQ
jgi:hypothetical protein